MFAFLSTGTELRRFGKGTLPKIALVVLMFIPLIYGALYLWAFWAPDKELSHLPVALVNSDTGATRDGEPVTAGDDLVDKLLDGHDLGWVETSAPSTTRLFNETWCPPNRQPQGAEPPGSPNTRR